MSMLLFLAAQAVTTAELQPDGFYVAGVRQDMTVAEYDALIANGRFKSEPVRRDVFWATINERRLGVFFCKGKVFRVMVDFDASSWLASVANLESAGFKWNAPYVLDTGDSQTMGIGVTGPANFSYFVVPILKSFRVGSGSIPTFQLQFEALNSECKTV